MLVYMTWDHSDGVRRKIYNASYPPIKMTTLCKTRFFQNYRKLWISSIKSILKWKIIDEEQWLQPVPSANSDVYINQIAFLLIQFRFGSCLILFFFPVFEKTAISLIFKPTPRHLLDSGTLLNTYLIVNIYISPISTISEAPYMVFLLI